MVMVVIIRQSSMLRVHRLIFIQILRAKYHQYPLFTPKKESPQLRKVNLI